MKWTEILEQRKVLLVSGVVLICVAALIVTARRFNVTLDIYWHIKTGIDWLASGLSPWQDHYSFTYYGEAIKSQPYVFQLIVGSLVSSFGVETGLEIFRVISFLMVFALAFLFLRVLKSPTAVYLLVLPMLTVMLQQRSVSRPELLSYSLIVVAVMLYHRARLQMTVSTMLPIVAVMWLWNNYHSVIFGYIIFFGLFGDTAYRYLRERASSKQWLRWLGWGIAVVAVGSLKPGFQIPLLGLLSFSPEWKDLIMEYAPLSAKLHASGSTFAMGIYSFGLMSLVTIVLAARKQYFGLVFVCGLLVLKSIEMSRLVTPAGIMLVCVFAWMISEVEVGERVRSLPRWVFGILGSTSLVVFGICMYSVVVIAQENMMLNRTFTTGFPDDVTDYMIENQISGRIFNDYEDGGYLIYRLAPDSQVYIDGRTNILYPLDHAKLSQEAKLAPGVLIQEIEKYDIDLAILKNKQANFSLIEDTNSLELDYVGFEHSLFRKEEANFPVLGSLLARPACWSADKVPALREEQDKAVQLLPERSPALSYLEFVFSYSNSSDKTAFFSNIDDYAEWNDYSLRFAAYQALGLGLNEQAWELFGGIRTRVFADFLAAGLSRVQSENWKEAEVALDTLTRIKWSIVKQGDLKILHRLLEQIRANYQIELIDDVYIDGLAAQFGGSVDTHSVPDVQALCAAN